MTDDTRPLGTVLPSVALLIVAFIAAGCEQHSKPSVASEPEKPWQVIVSGDTRGYLIPCGCTSNQSGGLPRRATYIADQRREHAVIYVDAGGAAGGDSPYDRLRFEAILTGESRMGIAAHNLGESELRLGSAWLLETGRRLDIPFVSANTVTSEGTEIAPASRIIEPAAGARWLVVGVVSPAITVEGIRTTDPAEAVLREWSKWADSKPNLLVLAWMPEAELRALAQQLPEADIVVGSFTGQALAPERLGSSVLAAAANKGKFLVEITAVANGPTSQVVEITESFADDSGQMELLQSFRADLLKRNLSAAETSFVSSLARQTPAEVHIAGSDQCRQCHAAEADSWQASAHSHAWQTLVEKHAQMDAACQMCHTTGFGFPAGFASLQASAHRVDVGCESCHGPSERHAQNPTIRTPFRAADQCVSCHDPENSPRFEYAAYWDRIRHGDRSSPESTK